MFLFVCEFVSCKHECECVHVEEWDCLSKGSTWTSRERESCLQAMVWLINFENINFVLEKDELTIMSVQLY